LARQALAGEHLVGDVRETVPSRQRPQRGTRDLRHAVGTPVPAPDADSFAIASISAALGAASAPAATVAAARALVFAAARCVAAASRSIGARDPACRGSTMPYHEFRCRGTKPARSICRSILSIDARWKHPAALTTFSSSIVPPK